MRTINDNYKRLKEATSELKALRETFSKQEKSFCKRLNYKKNISKNLANMMKKQLLGYNL